MIRGTFCVMRALTHAELKRIATMTEAGKLQTGARRKRYEEVSEHLELLIFSGRLSVGDKIASERELMLRFGVGRSTVREALFALQRKGLLSARPGAAARVETMATNPIKRSVRSRASPPQSAGRRSLSAAGAGTIRSRACQRGGAACDSRRLNSVDRGTCCQSSGTRRSGGRSNIPI
jgi:DNA-binding transcriptional regulator YhcF (GntR family)